MSIIFDHDVEFNRDSRRVESGFNGESDSQAVVVGPGEPMPAAVSDRLTLRACFGGRVALKVGETRLGLDDDVYHVSNPHSQVTAGPLVEPGGRYIAVQFSESLVRRCLLREEPGSAAREADGFIEHLRPYEPGIGGLIRDVVRLAAKPEDQEALDERIEELLVALLAARHREALHVDSLGHARERTRQEIYRRVVDSTDYLLSHYYEPLQLKQLADVACLAKFHYLRMFVAVHGVTPMEYLRCKRVSVASRLLLADSAPLATIARRVGVADRSTLLRLFIDYRRTTPDQYRRDNEGRGPESVPDTLLAELVRDRANSKRSSARNAPDSGADEAGDNVRRVAGSE